MREKLADMDRVGRRESRVVPTQVKVPTFRALLALATLMTLSPLFGSACLAEMDSAQNRRVFETRLHELLQETQSVNPALKAAGEKAAAASATADAARSLEPPLVGVDFYQIPLGSFPDPVKNLDETDYFLQQTVPFPGKLASRSNAERKRAETLVADSATLAADLRQQVQDAYYSLYLVDRREELLREDQALLRFLDEVARKRYEVGTGTQPDILRAQTELSTDIKDSIELHQIRASAQAEINSLRGRPGDTSIATVPEIPPPLTELTVERVLPLAQANRPEIGSLKGTVAARQAELTAAKKEFYPDFMLRGMYKQMRAIPDDWEFMVGVTVPIAPWSVGRYSSGSKSAQAQVAQANHAYRNLRNAIDAQVRDAFARVQGSQAQIAIIRGSILPQARQALQSTIAAYQTGRLDFSALIEARRALLDAQLGYHTAVVGLLRSRALLERAVGLDWERMEK